MKTSIPEKALDLRDRGFAYYRIAGELNISKDDAKQAVATARDDRKTWLTRQGPRGAQDNTPYRRTDPKPPTKAERYVAKVRGQR